MDNKLYCVRFGGASGSVWHGFIRPFYGVRDSETYSLKFMPPSMLDGIAEEFRLEGRVLRGKVECEETDKESVKTKYSTHVKHLLYRPVITLAFEKKSDAEGMTQRSIWCGQMEYLMSAISEVLEMDDSSFDKLPGFEAVQTTMDDPEAVYVGNNRQRGNEKMFVRMTYIPSQKDENNCKD